MPAMTRQAVWNLLGADAKPFALMMHRALHDQTATADDDEKAVAVMFSTVDDIDLWSPVVQQYVFPVLLAKGILTQDTVDRINAYISR